MRNWLIILLLSVVFVLTGCKARESQQTTVKEDSINVSVPDTSAAPHTGEGMAYREERDAEALREYERGLKFETGAGVAQDNEAAVKWYRQAADKGNALGQNALGSCYDYAKGVKEDARQAVKWYLASATQGYANAQFNLASCYHRGKGVAKNYKEAARLYRLAADQGLPIAQYSLGNCYFDGEGVSKDFQEAYFWGFIAVENGIDDLRGLRDAAAEQLRPQQKEDIRAKAVKWLAEHHR